MKRIILKNVSKNFQIGFVKNQNTLNRILSFCSGREPKRELCILDDVSFNVRSGDFIGIIGENAAGKSTLLRIIAGIYRADKGEVSVDGRIVSLIDLFIGLKDKLSMRDNLFLCCSLFGRNYSEIKKDFDPIVKFAGLERFVDAKIYQFSNGMKHRLISSIAIHCKPDVFLIDEDFEVGDENFKRKSAQAIKSIIDHGATALLVSHNLDSIRKYCNKAIWLHDGKIKMQGDTSSVIEQYLRKK